MPRFLFISDEYKPVLISAPSKDLAPDYFIDALLMEHPELRDLDSCDLYEYCQDNFPVVVPYQENLGNVQKLPYVPSVSTCFAYSLLQLN